MMAAIEAAIAEYEKPRRETCVEVSLPNSPAVGSGLLRDRPAEASSNPRFDGVRYGIGRRNTAIDDMYRRPAPRASAPRSSGAS